MVEPKKIKLTKVQKKVLSCMAQGHKIVLDPYYDYWCGEYKRSHSPSEFTDFWRDLNDGVFVERSTIRALYKKGILDKGVDDFFPPLIKLTEKGKKMAREL